MTESSKKTEKAGGASSSTTPPNQPGSAKPTAYQFEDIYTGYTTALHKEWMAAQDQLRDIHRECLQNLNEIQSDVHKEIQDACQRLTKTREDISGKENAPELWATAHREHANALNTAMTSGWKRSEDIRRNHRDALEAARAAHRKSNEASYQNFLNEMRNAWAGIDSSAVDVNNLNLISHLMLAASHSARMAMCHI